ncbi:Uracil-DNA glycosylase [Vibrio chagasii]|nr:Uracil-DNA glycosylase [Vibrio chagasii]
MKLIDEFNAVQKCWKDAIPNYEEQLASIEEQIMNISKGELVFPTTENIFRSMKETPLSETTVVILGQDPYHQYIEDLGVIIPQAMGLAFSVPREIKTPPSLKNIYKELCNSFEDYVTPFHGDISDWSKQGVLLLNTSLTVEYDKPNSHSKTGWKGFTGDIIKALISKKTPVVFLSWGKNAHAVTEQAEGTHHFVIKTSHPSPLGARKSGADFDSFIGSRCFSKVNKLLTESGQKPVDWFIT